MSQITIDTDRLAQIRTFDRGVHRDFEAGYCAMEAVAYIAREPWSDEPECVCPVIGTFMRAWNDGLPDADRTRLLLSLVPRLVGTRSTSAVESRRALMATDWLVRVMTPAWLRLAKLDARADALEALPEIKSTAQARSIYRPIATARRDAQDAWQAGLDVDWPPARVAAMDAGRNAAASAGWPAATDAAKLVAWGASDPLDEDESDRRLKLTVWLTARDGAKEAVDAAAWVGQPRGKRALARSLSQQDRPWRRRACCPGRQARRSGCKGRHETDSRASPASRARSRQPHDRGALMQACRIGLRNKCFGACVSLLRPRRRSC